jgi:tRNA 2-(methylsulfanyl)-N6-isopentenyladenosine37 hydroxylase
LAARSVAAKEPVEPFGAKKAAMLCLRIATDPAWIRQALVDVGALLVDQAYCELKAASNALSLAARHPNDVEIVRILTDVAQEEISHFREVLDFLIARGLTLGHPPVNAYAAELRAAAQALGGTAGPLVDRLLVAAIIEARSCERFKLLAEATKDDAVRADIHALWTSLLAAEAQHYRVFLDLAARAAGPGSRERISTRLEVLAQAECEIVRGLARSNRTGCRATIHG